MFRHNICINQSSFRNHSVFGLVLIKKKKKKKKTLIAMSRVWFKTCFFVESFCYIVINNTDSKSL